MGTEIISSADVLKEHAVEVQLGSLIEGRLLVDISLVLGAVVNPNKGNRVRLYITTGLKVTTHKGVSENGDVISTKPARLSLKHPRVLVGDYEVIYLGRDRNQAILRIYSANRIEFDRVSPQEDFNAFLANLQSESAPKQ